MLYLFISEAVTLCGKRQLHFTQPLRENGEV